MKTNVGVYWNGLHYSCFYHGVSCWPNATYFNLNYTSCIVSFNRTDENMTLKILRLEKKSRPRILGLCLYSSMSAMYVLTIKKGCPFERMCLESEGLFFYLSFCYFFPAPSKSRKNSYCDPRPSLFSNEETTVWAGQAALFFLILKPFFFFLTALIKSRLKNNSDRTVVKNFVIAVRDTGISRRHGSQLKAQLKPPYITAPSYWVI